MRACGHSTWEVEARKPKVQGHPGLQKEPKQPGILRLQEVVVPALEAAETGRKECGAETQQVHRGPQDQWTPVSPVKTICASEKE